MNVFPRILRAILIITVLMLLGIFILTQSDEYYQDVNTSGSYTLSIDEGSLYNITSNISSSDPNSIVSYIVSHYGDKILDNTTADMTLDINYVGPNTWAAHNARRNH